MSNVCYVEKPYKLQIIRDGVDDILYEVNVADGTPIDVGMTGFYEIDIERFIIEHAKMSALLETENLEYPVQQGDLIWLNGELVDFVSFFQASETIH